MKFLMTIHLGFAQQMDSTAQVDLIEILIRSLKINLREKNRDQREVYFSLFPTQSGVSGGDRALVTAFRFL